MEVDTFIIKIKHMEKLNKKISDYLAQETPEYFEGVTLYNQHPGAKNNLMNTFKVNFNKAVAQEKIINELEKLTGVAKYTNRRAVLNQSIADIPHQLFTRKQNHAPANYDYKVKFKNLPRDLQVKVIEKGQLYTKLEMQKKDLADIGTSNDEQSINKRGALVEEMQETSNRIKEIHREVLQYEEKGVIVLENEADTSTGSVAGAEPTTIDQFPDLIDVELENEFAYMQMSYYQLKDLLVKLRSSVAKQEQRASESTKPEVKQKNTEKAALGRKMIALLVKYFEENKEA